MSKTQLVVGNFFKIFIILISFLITTALAGENARIKAQLSSEIPPIPLEKAMGTKAYNDAIGSGEYRYVGSSKCRLCHRKFFIGRKKDPHDHSMKKLTESGHQENPKCLTCHATGFRIPTGFVSLEKTPRLSNVQCEGCHGPGNLHIKIAKKKKGKDGIHGFLAGSNNEAILKNMCTACHNKRWNKSYHDLDKAYDKYRKADPNSQQESRSSR